MSRIQITFQNEKISSTFWDIVQNETNSNMPSRRQLWRNGYNYGVMIAIMTQCIFRNFDVEYHRNRRDTCRILSLVGIYSTKAIMWCSVSIIRGKKDFLRYHEQLYDVESVLMSWIQIAFQNENNSSSFWDIVQNATKSNMPSRRQLWRNGYNYDVMIAIMT